MATSKHLKCGPAVVELDESAMSTKVFHQCRWSTPPRRILVVKKPGADFIDDQFADLILWMSDVKNAEVYVEPNVFAEPFVDAYEGIREKLFVFRKGNKSGIDLVITIGGDGTILHASTLFKENVPPVMAFNLGTLGFLASYDFAQYKEHVSSILDGAEANITLRNRLHCELTSTNGKRRFRDVALNEILINSGGTSEMCIIDVCVDGNFVATIRGDGIMVSTATGTTGHSASAGGALLYPTIPATIISSISPQSLAGRPLIIPLGAGITMTVAKAARSDNCWLIVDGHTRRHLSKAHLLTIKTSPCPVPLLCDDEGCNWFKSVVDNLCWNATVLDDEPAFSDVPTLPSSSSSTAEGN